MTIHEDALADTIPGACARLGISRSSAYVEIAQGRLRAVKARGRTLVTRVDQLEWLNSLPTVPAAAA